MRWGIARQAIEIDAALLERVDPKRATSGISKEKSTSCSWANSASLASSLSSALQRALGVLGAQRLRALVERQLAVDAVQRCRADLQVQIGALFLDELAQSSLDVEHALLIGSRRGEA